MIADFHNDVLTEGAVPLEVFAKKTACAVCAVFRGGRSFGEVASIAETFVRSRPPHLYLGLEDIGYYSRARAERICSWRPVYASLTWNGENALAGGCMSPARLTERGREAVRRLSEHGICIDVSHLNEAAFYDVLELMPYGIVASHSCFSAVKKHPRNLTDAQARAIAQYGGLIGVTFVGSFLTEGQARAEDVFRHIDHGVELCGIGHICLGTDFYGTHDLPQGLRGYADEERLCACFVKAGYSDRQTEAVISGNLSKFLCRGTGKRE